MTPAEWLELAEGRLDALDDALRSLCRQLAAGDRGRFRDIFAEVQEPLQALELWCVDLRADFEEGVWR